MNAQTYATPRATLAAPEMPNDLSSAESKLVYLYLSVTDEATVDDLNDDLGLQKLALFPVLDTLSENGLVDRDGERYRVSS
ncbi:MAG: TrmB family transcriptional regulator [Haloferacaceae archaeon]